MKSLRSAFLSYSGWMLWYIRANCRYSKAAAGCVLQNRYLWVSHQGLQACNFIRKRLQQRCFPVNIAKFLRTGFFTEHPPVADVSGYRLSKSYSLADIFHASLSLNRSKNQWEIIYKTYFFLSKLKFPSWLYYSEAATVDVL